MSDNASDDDTASVVASFRDPRLVYRPLERNIGRAANFNRLIDLAETEFVVLMGDDDQLHPEHLSRTVEALKRCPTAGLVHTGCTIVDISGAPPGLAPSSHRDPAPGPGGIRGAVPRAEHEVGLDGLLPLGHLPPGGLDRRRRPAAGGRHHRRHSAAHADRDRAGTWPTSTSRWPSVTAHSDASSSSLGSFTPNGFRASRSLPDMLYDRRRQFLDEADLPDAEAGRLARIAEKTYRRDVLGCLSTRARTGDGQLTIFRALGKEIRRDRRLGLDPMTGRFVIGQLGARRLRDALRRQVRPGGASTAEAPSA